MQELASDAQNCKNLEERYDVSMEPALFLTFQSLKILNLHLQENFDIYQSDKMEATTGLSFDRINGFYWSNNTDNIDESILLLINQTNSNDSCLKFFLNYNKGILLDQFSFSLILLSLYQLLIDSK